MPYVRGFLNIVEGGSPDNSLPGGGGGYPDNSLPGNQPGIDNSLPEPPPGIWPPPSLGNPIVPVDPGFGGGIPVQPGTIWPSPGRPNRPDNSLPGSGARPDHGLPPSPGHPGGGPMPGGERPDNTLPGGQGGEITNPIQPKTYWMLCYCPSLGWKYVAVDPSLRPGNALPGQPNYPSQGLPGQQPPRPDNTLPQQPGQPNRPDNTLPPTAQPRQGQGGAMLNPPPQPQQPTPHKG